MNIETRALVDWYQKQYDRTKTEFQRDCMAESFWDMAGINAEEQLMKKLMLMMQLRYRLDGLTKGGEE